MTEKERIFGLDFLRAGAVVAVLFHHTFLLTQLPEWIISLGFVGPLGVEVLMVMSGYLVGKSIIQRRRKKKLEKPRHLWEFFTRRWLRTLPAYFLFLLLSAVLYPSFVQALIDNKQYFLFLQNFAWAPPDFYFQTWTLTILEFFYLLFPIIFYLISKGVSSIRTSIFLLASLFFVACLGLRLLQVYGHCLAQLPSVSDEIHLLRTAVVLRLDSPIIGVLVALVEAEFPKVWHWLIRNYWVGATSLALFIAYMFLDCPGLGSSLLLRVFVFPLSSLSIALAIPLFACWKDNDSLFCTVTKAISQCSYSLYVSHVFAFQLGGGVAALLGISRETQWPLVCPILFLALALIAYPTFYFVERPFMNAREKGEDSPGYLQAMWTGLKKIRLSGPLSAPQE